MSTQVDPAEVMDSLLAPARALKGLADERDALVRDLAASRAEAASLGIRVSQLTAEVARLTVEIGRTGPVNPQDEIALCQRNVSLEFSIRVEGSKAGHPRVTLRADRQNPIEAFTALDAVDAFLGVRTPRRHQPQPAQIVDRTPKRK